MRSMPLHIALAPIPPDFTTPITDDGHVLKASVRINGLLHEIGLRPARTPEALSVAREHLRQGIWQLHELARIGGPDLMAYAAADRHTNRRRSGA